jgi:hypothetical protein
MAQCYKPQELEEINRSVLISMANAQRSIVAMLIKFKPGKKKRQTNESNNSHTNPACTVTTI